MLVTRLREGVELPGGALTLGPHREILGDELDPRYYYQLGQLDARGWLERILSYEGQAIMRLEAIAPGFRYDPPPFDPDQLLKVSRFALLREHVLECPLGLARLHLSDWRAAALFYQLDGSRTLRQLDLWDEATRRAAVEMFQAAGILHRNEGRDELPQWDFHDLLFHARSRWGRHRDPLGATWRLSGKRPPLPALKPAQGRGIELERSQPLPFDDVLQKRRSVRSYGPPLSIGQLGQFLDRCLRIRETRTVEPHGFQITFRPSPGGGGVHELEVYLAVGACQGLEPGFYHYHAAQHSLHRLEASADGFLQGARAASGADFEPQIVLVLAARIERLTFKYSAMAYATVLKDVGALFQTMYLAATAMGLAPCALGAGDVELFARSAGQGWDEVSVGEFCLGSLPQETSNEPRTERA